MSVSDEPADGGTPPGSLGELTRRMFRLMSRLSASDLRDVEIAATPADEIAREGKMRVTRYRPVAEPRGGPLIIVHGLIGRQTIADLEPGRSLVERLLAAGIDTYAIDWGNPTRADRFLDFCDYADLSLGTAIEAVREASGAARAALFGICQGGVFGLCQAALNPERLKGLALAVTPVDFHADTDDPDQRHGHLNVWTRNLPPGLVDRMLDEVGNLPGQFTGAVFQSLTPARTLAKYTSDLIEIAEDEGALETFMRMEKWLADRPDLPGATARQWLVELYSENRLVRHRFEVGGRTVRLDDIACPVLNIFGADDHIVPPPCSRALGSHLRNVAYREVEVPTGHIGVFVSRKAQSIVPPAVIDWVQSLD